MVLCILSEISHSNLVSSHHCIDILTCLPYKPQVEFSCCMLLYLLHCLFPYTSCVLHEFLPTSASDQPRILVTLILRLAQSSLSELELVVVLVALEILQLDCKGLSALPFPSESFQSAPDSCPISEVLWL